MCDIGTWREAIGLEKGIEEGKAKKEEELITAFLNNATTPEMAPEDIITMLCRSFGFSPETARKHYERYISRCS